jgi:hypothetical protein
VGTHSGVASDRDLLAQADAHRELSSSPAFDWLIGFYAVLGGILRLVASYRIHQFHSEVKSAIGRAQPTGA